MRKASFQKNHQEFEDRLKWYASFIAKILIAKNVIRYGYEKIELLEALVLRIATLWDGLVEEDLIDALNKDPSKYAKEVGLRLRKHLSKDECEALLVGHRYLDFKSVDNVQQFAKRYLADAHNPFKLIPRECAKLINQFFTIRHYLNHDSSFARRNYERMLNNQHGLRKMREPGDFLLATNRQTGNIRLIDYLNAFERASQEMRKIGS